MLFQVFTWRFHSWWKLVWLPLQSLAVKNILIFFAHFGRWKTFKILWELAGEKFLGGLRGAKHFSVAFCTFFRVLFSRFSNHFSYQLNCFSGAVSFCRSAALRKSLMSVSLKTQSIKKKNNNNRKGDASPFFWASSVLKKRRIGTEPSSKKRRSSKKGGWAFLRFLLGSALWILAAWSWRWREPSQITLSIQKFQDPASCLAYVWTSL